jgi:hypothetical protein
MKVKELIELLRGLDQDKEIKYFEAEHGESKEVRIEDYDYSYLIKGECR